MSDEWRGMLVFESIEDGRAVFYCADETAFKAGQKYLAVLTEVPDEAPQGEDRRASRGSKASPSGIARALCEQEGFQRWAADAMGKLGRGRFVSDQVTARRLVFETCGISEFEQLDLDERALMEFRDRIEVPYYRYVTTARKLAERIG